MLTILRDIAGAHVDDFSNFSKKISKNSFFFFRLLFIFNLKMVSAPLLLRQQLLSWPATSPCPCLDLRSNKNTMLPVLQHLLPHKTPHLRHPDLVVNG